MTTLTATMGTWAIVGFFGVSTILLIAPVVWLAELVVDACIDDDHDYDTAVDAVERFLDLTDRSRRELASAELLPLLHPRAGAAASTAIGRALELKQAARHEIWTLGIEREEAGRQRPAAVLSAPAHALAGERARDRAA